MRRLRPGPNPRLLPHVLAYLTWTLFSTALADQLAPQTVQLPSLNLQSLGKLAVVGNFDSISEYTYTGQQNDINAQISPLDSVIVQTNGEQDVKLADTNGHVSSSCMLNDSLVFFAGNFTVAGSATPAGIAYLNLTSGDIKSLPSGPTNGTISTLYCDAPSNSVFAGGSFSFNGTAGVAVWDNGSGKWKSAPFGGFVPSDSASVNSIVAFNDSLVFGGQFSGINGSNDALFLNATATNSSDVAPSQLEQQVSFNLASVSAEGTDSSSSATSILCPSSDSAWKLTDDRQGTWTATVPFSFTPTRLRLYNLNDDTDGTKTFRFLAFPLNGILNLTYVDPSTGNFAVCNAWCPLPQQSTQPFTDFFFVNPIAMDSFQLFLLDFYGSAAGLSGVELFQNDLVTFANNTLNEPLSCQNANFVGGASTEGNGWSTSTASETNYLTTTISDEADLQQAEVTFEPNITTTGNYSVLLFTPGCMADGTCAQRGGVNVTIIPSKDAEPQSLTLFQTNDFDKYDAVFNGTLDASDGFTPQVIVRPATTDTLPVVFVAQKVQYILLTNVTNSTNSTFEPIVLNGLFEYSSQNFSQFESNSSFVPVGNTIINQAGANMSSVKVTSLLVHNDSLLIGGAFTGENSVTNLAMLSSNGSSLQPLPGSNINGVVNSIVPAGNDSIIVIGNFSQVSSSNLTNVEFAAGYNFTAQAWGSFQGGFNGPVQRAVAYDLNSTATVLFTGSFSQVSNFTVSDGLAIWVNDESNWLQASTFNGTVVAGHLSGSDFVNSTTQVYFGSLKLQGSRAPSGAFVNDDLSLRPMPFQFSSSNGSSNSSASGLSKRATIAAVSDGNSINTGVFANGSLSIYGGHFKASGSSGNQIENVLFLNGSETFGLPENGVGSDGSVYSLLVSGSRVYIGGSFSSEVAKDMVSGVLFYDMENNTYPSTQPPGISGSQSIVTSLNIRPNSNDLVVMGSFEQAGSLGCNAFCIYDLDATRWTSPSPGLSGLISTATFIGDDVIFFAGDLTLNDTNVYFSQYDFTSSSFSTEPQLSKHLPGPVNSFVLNGNGFESMFASGVSNSTGKAYLSYWNNTAWTSLDSLLGEGTVITQLTLLQLQNNHKSNSILPDNELLLVTGNLVLQNFGNASSAMYDGNSWQPLYLTSGKSSSGTINAFVSQSTQTFSTPIGKHFMKRGFVVLIALAIAVGLIMLLILLGLLVSYIRRRRQGYRPAPSRVSEADMTQTVPPESLLREMETVGHNQF